ncbi:MAG: hypothetical protein IH614_20230 [Desulfuromonadales bacterium]|nr:hypothetical protein [Desulfuromonadales bacterium]
MGDKPEPEQEYDACLQPTEHRDHLCVLMERGQTAEVRRRSSRPAFACRNCDCRAHLATDLCNPVPLEE